MPGFLLLEDAQKQIGDRLGEFGQGLFGQFQQQTPAQPTEQTVTIQPDNDVVQRLTDTGMQALNAPAEAGQRLTDFGMNLIGQGITNIQPEPPPAPPTPAPEPTQAQPAPSMPEDVTRPPTPVSAAAGGANPNPSPEEVRTYITQAAQQRGIDPNIALRVAQSEGGMEAARRGTFKTGSSWWPFQLHYGGPGYEQLGNVAGMGNAFTRETGFAPGDPKAWQAATDYALDRAKSGGWGAWYGAKAQGIEGFEGINRNAPDVPFLQRAGEVVGGAIRGAGEAVSGAVRDISQFGDKQLTSEEAYAACGPAAAVRFAQRMGRNPSLKEALDMAKTVGWTAQQGMAGLTSEKALMDKMGVETQLVSGPQWDRFAAEAQTGNPVTISTSAHYFYADGYNPDTGQFHVGRSGTDLRGGKEWMTRDEIVGAAQRLGGGTVQGALFANNPVAPSNSTTTSMTMGPMQPGFTAPSMPEDVTRPLPVPEDRVQAIGEGMSTVREGQLTVLDDVIDRAGKGDTSLGRPFRDLGTAVSGMLEPARRAYTPSEENVELIEGVGRGILQSPATPWGAAEAMGNVGQAIRPGLEQAREQVANAPVLGGALGMARGPLLLTDQEVLEQATPAELENARRGAQLTNSNPSQQEIADVLRGLRTGEAYAGERTGPRRLEWPVRDTSFSGRPTELRAEFPDELRAPSSTSVFRGLTDAEMSSIQQTGQIKSTGAYSHASEGTSFGDDFALAESAINYGRDNPARTGRPTYVIEVSRGPDIVPDPRDGFPKAAGAIPADRILRVWRFEPDGSVTEATGGEGYWRRAEGEAAAPFAAGLGGVAAAGAGLAATGQRGRGEEDPTQRAQDIGRGILQSPLTPWGAAEAMGSVGPALRESGFTAPGGPLDTAREQIANAPVLGGALDIARQQTWLVSDQELLEQATPQELETARRGAELTNPNPSDDEIAGVLRGLRAGENAAAGIDVAALARARAAARAAAPAPAPARPATALEKGVAVGVNNMLGGTASMVSNAVSGVGENLYRPFATAVVKGEFGPAWTDLRAQGAAVGDALAGMVHTFRTGERRAQLDPTDYPEAFPGAAGMLPFTSGNLRANAAMDEANSILAIAGGQGAEAARIQRANPSLSTADIIRQFPKELEDAGRSAQQSATFQSGGTGFGEQLAGARRAATDPTASPQDRAKGVLATLLVPFSKIPDAIVTRGVLTTPGFAEGALAARVTQAVRKGDPEAVKTAVRQWATTEAVNSAIAWQVLQGNITGNGPEGKAKRDAMMNARDENGNPVWQPNSFRVPTPWGNRFIPYSSLGPISVRMGAIANFVEQFDQAEGKVDANLLTTTGKAIGETITDAWYLQNLGRTYEAMKNGKLFDAGGNVLLDFAERYVPDAALANQLRQHMDPVVREPRNPLEDVANRVPFASQLVPPRINPATGEPLERPRDIGSALVRSAAPGVPDPINEALASHNLGVSEAPKTITQKKFTIDINDDEQRQYTIERGKAVAENVRKLIDDPRYDTWSYDDQREALQKAVSDASADAAAVVWNSIPGTELDRRDEAYKAREAIREQPQFRGFRAP